MKFTTNKGNYDMSAEPVFFKKKEYHSRDACLNRHSHIKTMLNKWWVEVKINGKHWGWDMWYDCEERAENRAYDRCKCDLGVARSERKVVMS